MCVIIFVPKGETIEEEELKKAWETNPHGAGYATRATDPKTGELKVLFHRGFMEFNPFYDEIKNKIGRQDLLLHFRITTSSVINQLQTHPYKKGNVYKLKGLTDQPVICMNGSIYGQTVYNGFNDTMSYIQDNGEAFKIIAKTGSKELLNIVQEATGSRWAIITPDNILLSSDFKEHNGKYYSNLNHIQTTYVKSNCTIRKNPPTLKSLLTKKLYRQVKKDKILYYQLIDFIEIWQEVPYIIDQITQCYSIGELEALLWSYY